MGPVELDSKSQKPARLSSALKPSGLVIARSYLAASIRFNAIYGEVINTEADTGLIYCLFRYF